MSKRWIQNHHNDAHFRQAKREGYRARSAYKLMEINRRYRLIRAHDDVVDLGAAPGGWLQVIRKLTDGRVIGIDLNRIEPMEGVVTIRGDMTSPNVRDRLRDVVGEKVNTVVSDMAPNMSGNYSVDQARSVHLAEMALTTARSILAPGGNLVVKVFEGDLFHDFLMEVKGVFSQVKVHNPRASRKSSSEVYVIARNFSPRELKRGRGQPSEGVPDPGEGTTARAGTGGERDVGSEDGTKETSGKRREHRDEEPWEPAEREDSA